MKIFTTSQIRDIDACTIQNEPVASIDLMERAGKACTNWICEKFDRNEKIIIFTGPGNNGGDGWTVARLLTEQGFPNIRVCLLRLSAALSPDSAINRERLIEQHRIPVAEIASADDFPVIKPSDIVIDALFGSGLTRPLTSLPANLIKHINSAGCRVIAIDIPSGLMGEDNTGNIADNIIKANHTLTFQFPKLSFFFPENEMFVGNWTVLDIGLRSDCIEKTDTPYYYIYKEDIAGLVKPRRKFSHKGMFGHALLVAGSYGMMGAAVLASRACLRAGAGLVSVHVPLKGCEIIQTTVPEAIVSLDPSETCFSRIPDLIPYNAIGVGPGIGRRTAVQKALNSLLIKCPRPMVIDADALNLIAAHKGFIEKIPENSILTPHPKEFERLAGVNKNGYDRLMKQIAFARKHKVILVLKGAHTSVALPDGKSYFNSTGNPGMASGGSGDVLTGIILSFMAQGYEPAEAAIAGVYLHGLAGDIAVRQKGQQALIASDIADNIGNAFLQTETS
ncbi:MAG: NAD(P)H-hydrate dehydratase [Bacteroidales bacterium]|nr:NAD(P)H-hydrate dehydratase [Bacteroidales bacterium]MBN2764003.1 NAD(P)H-hydrate dehydratase [Bacteroidales bacterium]